MQGRWVQRTLRGVVTAIILLGAAPLSAGGREAILAPEAVARANELRASQGAAASNLMFAQIHPGYRHKGYNWLVEAYKRSPASKTRLTFAFFTEAAEGTQQQQSAFSWTLPRRALSADENLAPASLVTRKGMGSNGSISMKLAKGSRYIRTRAPDGCRGAISYRIGRLVGRLAVNLRDQHFRKIDLRGSTVVLYREHDVRCAPGPHVVACADDLSLSLSDTEQGLAVGIFRTEEGRVDQQVAVARKSGDADGLHRISVTLAVPEAFEASEDLTTATVDADMAGPWLSGDLDYVAPPPASEDVDPDCGPYRATSGIATGDFAAHFDAVGTVTPTTGLGATLREEEP